MRNWRYCLEFQNRSFSGDTESFPWDYSSLEVPGHIRVPSDLLPSTFIVGCKVCGAACKHSCSLCEHFQEKKAQFTPRIGFSSTKTARNLHGKKQSETLDFE